MRYTSQENDVATLAYAPPKMEEYQRLAASIALQFLSPGADLESSDEYAESLILLWRASKKYDPTRGFKFTTYATSVITKGLRRRCRHKLHIDFCDPVIFNDEIDQRPSLVNFERILQNLLSSIQGQASTRDIRIFRDDALGLATRSELALEHDLTLARIGQIVTKVLDVLRTKYQNSEEMDVL